MVSMSKDIFGFCDVMFFLLGKLMGIFRKFLVIIGGDVRISEIFNDSIIMCNVKENVFFGRKLCGYLVWFVVLIVWELLYGVRL